MVQRGTSADTIGGKVQKERAKARWSILRSALLDKAKSTAESEHSIRRFPGYSLLRPRSEPDISAIDKILKHFEWNDQQSEAENQQSLQVALHALGACHPKGACLQVHNIPSTCETWLSDLQESCRPTVTVLVVQQDSPQAMTLLVQESSSRSTTHYQVCEYTLDTTCSLFTREPREARLGLMDLVCHRTTGVDNTGNVCVWDSERSLAYLLYHHWKDVHKVALSSPSPPPRNLLELGTGMAGLAAISLGLRLAQDLPSGQGAKINVTLTDGHPDGVKNNIINQSLTKAHASGSDSDKHPYHMLNISAHTLLWDRQLKHAQGPPSSSQDMVLVSDCTHFQDFHTELTITMLRLLRVGGTALFCQPTRGNSLQNFHSMLTTPNTVGLVHCQWWGHDVLEEQHRLASEKHQELYDENLHRPKILIVTKVRDLTESDCEEFARVFEARGGTSTMDK